MRNGVPDFKEIKCIVQDAATNMRMKRAKNLFGTVTVPLEVIGNISISAFLVYNGKP